MIFSLPSTAQACCAVLVTFAAATSLPAQFRWDQAHPGAPEPRASAALAWDPVSQRGVLFGGVDAVAARSDTWVLEVLPSGAPEWRRLATAHAPAARFDHAMVSTPRGVLLFGGMDDQGAVLGDTWLFGGGDWQILQPAVVPPARAGHAMGYDPVRDRAVLFGGGVGTTVLDDTWDWDGAAWQRKSVSIPPPGMRDAAMAFDPATGGLLLHGTSRGAGYSYTWDGRGWWTLASNGPARRDHQLVFDPAARTVLMVGGVEGAAEPTEVLRFSGSSPSYSWVVDGQLPSGRCAHTVLRVPGVGQLFVTGGRYGDHLEEDTLRLERQSRTWQPVVEVPAARKWFEMVRDPVRDRAFLFGGYATGSVDGYLRELWSYGADGWRRHPWPDQGPEFRFQPQLAYDAGRDRLVVCGGTRIGATYVLPDTWEFEPATGTWHRGPDMPYGGLTGGQMVYDPVRSRCVLFGGYHTFGSVAPGETWSYDGSSWQRLATAGPPPAYSHRMTWVPGRDEILLVADSIVQRSSQTWTFDGVAWTRQSPLHQPPPFRFQALVHQPLRDRCTLIHPVTDLVTGLPPAELWEWDGIDWLRRDRPAGGLPAPLEAGVWLDHEEGIIQFGGSFETTSREVWALRSASPAAASGFGVACVGAGGETATLAAAGLPWIGDTLRLEVHAARIPAGSLLWFGVSDTRWSGGSLPQDLSGFGFTGCRLLVSDDVIVGLPAGTGTTQLPVPLPADPSLVGSGLFAQALVIASAANPSGGLLSNGIALRIGSRD